MEALIKACEQENFPAEIALVFSNRPDAQGLKTAQAHEIPIEAINHKDFEGRDDFEESLLNMLERYDFDAICLAGFMRLLSADFVNKFQSRIINIHPSLLPDYKGVNTHERVLADGKKKSGCTVHYVVPEMDSGEIIVQRTVDVLSNDTTETLAARVLDQEHIAYPEAVKILAKKILDS